MPDPSGWTPQRRSALVLEILKGSISVADAARVHGLAPSEILDWQRVFLRGGEQALGAGPEPTFPASVAASTRWAGVALAGTLLVWLVLRAVYFNGYYTEDSPGYVTDALYLVTGDYRARDHVNGLNVGTYLPVALPLTLFGKSEIALALWPLGSSLLGLLSLFGAATVLFGRRFGLLGALLYATYPGDIFFSTVVMPDAIQAGWLTFSVFLAVWAYAGPGRRRCPALFAAGLAMGTCHLVRANGPLFVPIGLAAVVALGWGWRREAVRATAGAALVFVAGWLTVQALEGLVYLWAAGDLFHRVHVVAKHYGSLQSIGRWGLNTDWSTIPFSIFPPLLWWWAGGWGAFNQDQAYHGLIFCLALGGLVVGTLAAGVSRLEMPPRVKAGLAVAAFWFAWPLLYHQFGSQSLTSFVPIHRLSRHLVVYAPGATFAAVAGCALVAGVAARWRSAGARRTLAAAAVVGLVLHLGFNWAAERAAHRGYDRIKRTYVRIREHLPAEVRTIVADPGDLGFFDFWLNPTGVERVRLRAFATYSRCEDLPEGVVLTWSNPGWEGLSAPVIQETVRRLPCLLQPPPDWRLLYEGFPEKIYVTGPQPMR